MKGGWVATGASVGVGVSSGLEVAVLVGIGIAVAVGASVAVAVAGAVAVGRIAAMVGSIVTPAGKALAEILLFGEVTINITAVRITIKARPNQIGYMLFLLLLVFTQGPLLQICLQRR